MVDFTCHGSGSQSATQTDGPPEEFEVTLLSQTAHQAEPSIHNVLPPSILHMTIFSLA